MQYPGIPAHPDDVFPEFTGDFYGQRITVEGKGDYVWCYWDGSAPSTCSKGDWVFFGTAGQIANNPAIAAAATSSVQQDAGVVTKTLSAAGGVWVHAGPGRCDIAKIDGGTDVAKGDMLQLVNGAVHVVKDGGAALTADSVAIAEEAETDTIAAQTSAGKDLASHSVYLLGRKVTIG